MLADPDPIAELRARLQGKNPRVILKEALARYPRIAVSFSGAEDVAVVAMAAEIRPGVAVFTLDTGRLHPETYRFIEAVRTRYPIELQIVFPEATAVEALTRQKGLFSFFEDGHSECCGIRKVEPLRRHLQQLDAWITGQRRDQNPTRQELPEVEWDTAFSRPEHPLVKFNPLANWTSTQVWDYLEAHSVPVNELHLRGYASIGCEPCTRPVLRHQHEREGRWWWEDAAKKECGLHAGNLKKTD